MTIFPRTTAIFLGLLLATLPSLGGASASDLGGMLFVDADGQPDFTPPTGWEVAARSQQDGRRVLEFGFSLPGETGAKAVARVTLWKLARSTRLADLTPLEAAAVERGRDAAFAAREKEVETLPEVHFLSGGTQFVYTALEGSQRFRYAHFVGVTGVPDAKTDLKSAIAVDLRCRNAIDEETSGHEAAAEALETTCYELMRSF
jgi:hypothetical protein